MGDNDPDHGELPGDYTEPICYLGQCCGPFGTGRLYYSLAQDTGDDSYLDLIKDSIDGYESLGAPEHKSAGLRGMPANCSSSSACTSDTTTSDGSTSPDVPRRCFWEAPRNARTVPWTGRSRSYASIRASSPAE